MCEENKGSDVVFCSNCQDFVSSFMRDTTETLHVHDTDITVTSPGRICGRCQQILFDPILDNDKLKLAYRIYRDMKGMLQPEEIREIRERYHLSQQEFSDILGLDGKKIERYENGSLQSMAENNLILLMKNPQNLHTLLSAEGKNMNPIDYEPVRHAKWEYKCYPTVWYGPGEPPEWICSGCQDMAYNTYDYCPNCGARMDSDEEDVKE